MIISIYITWTKHPDKNWSVVNHKMKLVSCMFFIFFFIFFFFFLFFFFFYNPYLDREDLFGMQIPMFAYI